MFYIEPEKRWTIDEIHHEISSHFSDVLDSLQEHLPHLADYEGINYGREAIQTQLENMAVLETKLKYRLFRTITLPYVKDQVIERMKMLDNSHIYELET